MTAVSFPVLDEAAPDSEGVVATWFATDGAPVQAGDLLAEVQVSKTSEEVHAPASGTLRHVAAEGQVLAQGAVLGHIE